MKSFIQTLSGFLLLFECCVNARYIGLSARDAYTYDWREVFADLQPRQSTSSGGPTCRSVCGDCGSSCSLSKRSLLGSIASNGTSIRSRGEPISLQKRVFTAVTQGEVGSFLEDKTDALVPTSQNANTNLINLIYSTAQNDYTFGALRRFSDFTGTNILNIGTGGLEGCTVITIVSPTAVYMAHIFENLAFYQVSGTKDPDTAFQQNCLNFLSGSGQTWRTRGDTLDPSLFSGDNGPAVAYIMTPREDQADPTAEVPDPPVPGPTSQLYSGRITQIKTLLTQLIDGITVLDYNYIALNVPTAAYQGVALFEYDPNADGQGHPNFRLWYEQTMGDGISIGLFHED